ncbi:MAG: hypothetical protein ABIM99_03085 [Candidatus Dojkabacteria bacterium]
MSEQPRKYSLEELADIQIAVTMEIMQNKYPGVSLNDLRNIEVEMKIETNRVNNFVEFKSNELVYLFTQVLGNFLTAYVEKITLGLITEDQLIEDTKSFAEIVNKKIGTDMDYLKQHQVYIRQVMTKKGRVPKLLEDIGISTY